MPNRCERRATAAAGKRTRGYTLIEVAIVLIIIGLLLGAVLKGQELLVGARVRNIVKQQDEVKTAYFGFVDRYRSLPGDYASAATHISGISTAACNGGNGNGNWKIEAGGSEDILVWEHLSKAGFLQGGYTCAAAASGPTSPINVYGDFLDLIYDSGFAGVAPSARHNLKTGGHLRADLLAEVDRKIDDANALQGTFRGYAPPGQDPAACWNATSGLWLLEGGGANCGGALLL